MARTQPTRIGNREALLGGAFEALLDLGYAGTTSRAVADRAGTSLAAIGYHFGSTQALLQAAIAAGFRTWRERLATAVESAGGSAEPAQAMAAIGAELDRLFVEDRKLFAVFLEALALTDRAPRAVAGAAAAYDDDRRHIAALVARVRGRSTEEDGVISSALIATVDGLFVQHLLDPQHAPQPSSVLRALTPALLHNRETAR